MFQLSKQI